MWFSHSKEFRSKTDLRFVLGHVFRMYFNDRLFIGIEITDAVC